MSHEPGHNPDGHKSDSLKDKIWRVIFLSDTNAAKTFDIILMWAIGISVAIVMLESVESFSDRMKRFFFLAEWVFTILFSIEYAIRIWVVRKKKKFIFSFYGIIDLISIIPTYLTILVNGTHYLLVLRILRLLRIFRVLKMTRHIGEANHLISAMRASWAKISVFIFYVLAVTMILGTMMYIVEGGDCRKRRIQQCAAVDLLGNRDHFDSGLRGRDAGDRSRKNAGYCHHPDRLRDHRGANGNCDG